jgi:hypothetical protein
MSSNNNNTTNVTNDPNAVITLFPNRINFGVIAQGFLYQLKFNVQNNTKEPLRIRVLIDPFDSTEMNVIRLKELPDNPVAPGLCTQLILELTAEHLNTSRFILTITQNLTNMIYYKDVEANIVNIRTFKHVKKSLSLQNRPIYHANVS